MDFIFDILLMPFRTESPWPAMIAISFLTALIVIIIFKYTSNQQRLKSSKGVLIGRLLELHLFRHDVTENFRAFGRVIIANILYLKVFIKPMVIALLPMVIIFIQAEKWFTYRPLQIGESTLITITVKESFEVISTPIDVKTSKNIEITAPPVRIPHLNQSIWRLQVKEKGEGWAEILSGEQSTHENIITGRKTERIENGRKNCNMGPIKSITIDYPKREVIIAGKNPHWILIYILLTLILSIPMKKILKVDI